MLGERPGEKPGEQPGYNNSTDATSGENVSADATGWAIEGFAESIEHTVDARGLLCPEPLMIVRNRVRQMAAGERVAIVATDPSTRRDFANFCRFMGHTLLVDEPRNGRFEFVIQKSIG